MFKWSLFEKGKTSSYLFRHSKVTWRIIISIVRIRTQTSAYLQDLFLFTVVVIRTGNQIQLFYVLFSRMPDFLLQ